MRIQLKFCITLLLTLAFPAAAAEWVRIHTTGDGDQYYYDRSKLFISGDEITYWKKVTFKTAPPVKNQYAASGLFRERIHCAEHTLKLISYLLYAADGATIEYVSSNEGEAAPIIPDTLGDIFEKSACELVRQKHEELRRKPAEDAKKTEIKNPEIAPMTAAPASATQQIPALLPVMPKPDPTPPVSDMPPAPKGN